MDYEFSSLKDLYLRVEPALNAKRNEFQRLGFTNIENIDIWNALIEVKWKKGKDLMLNDIVDDILNTDCNVLNEKINNKKEFLCDTDII